MKIIYIAINANPTFVIVSYCISVLGAFTTFQFVNETKFVTASWKKLLLVAGASVSMGFCAIWAMHFLGTLCFSFEKVEQTLDSSLPIRTPLKIEYDIGITLISAVVAVILCFVGFMISTLQQFTSCFRKYVCCPFFTQHDAILVKEEDVGGSLVEFEEEMLDQFMFRGTIKLEGEEKITTSTGSTDALPEKPKHLATKFLPSNAELRSYVFGSPHKPHIIQLMVSSFFNASGVAAMHYLGMIATHIDQTKMVFNGWLVALACLIAYVASFAAFWISFNLKNHVFKAISSFVAACAVAGMHYVGMVSCSYEYSTTPHVMVFPTDANVTNTDLAMGTTIATSAACFFLLVMLTAARNVLSRTISQLKREKRTVEKFSSQLQQTVVQMNALLNQVAFEEHQIRKVMDCLVDPVCVVDEYGNLMKANRKFRYITGVNSESRHCITDFFPEASDSMKTFFAKHVSRDVFSPSVKLSMKLKSLFQEQTVNVEIFQEKHSQGEAIERCFYIWVIQNESISNFFSQRGSMFIHQEESSFDADLENPEFFSKFKTFCLEERCAEGLLFLEKVKQYKSCENTIERIELQKRIATEFIEIDSDNQLNLSQKALEDSLERIQSAYGQPDLFDELSKQVKDLLQHSYTRFRHLVNNT